MTRCQHCDRLTHSEHLYVYFDHKDLDKVFELQSLECWTPGYMYDNRSSPSEMGKLKCGDIYIHFVVSYKNDENKGIHEKL